MMRKLFFPILASVTFACGFTAVAAQENAQQPVNKTSPLIGAWRMTMFEAGSAGHLKAIPYSGQLVVTEAGTLSAQAMNPDADAPDTPYTRNGYEALYGHIRIDDASGTFSVKVDSSLTRNLIGKEMVRSFRVNGDRLVLMPANPEEGWRVTYERYR